MLSVGAVDNQNLLRGPRSLSEAPHQGCRLTYEDVHTTSGQHKCGKRYISNRRGTEEHSDISPIFKKHVMMKGSLLSALSHRKNTEISQRLSGGYTCFLCSVFSKFLQLPIMYRLIIRDKERPDSPRACHVPPHQLQRGGIWISALWGWWATPRLRQVASLLTLI